MGSMGRSINQRWRILALAALAQIMPALATASEPLAASGTWDSLDEINWLLRDPLTAKPGALLHDPSGWLLSAGGSGVIQGSVEPNPAGLDIVSVDDVLPEFWAQPCVWNPVQRGPSAYSGFGTDAGPREWAGRTDFDRRAYALDPGSRAQDELAAPETPGAGTITIQVIPGSLVLIWHGLSGRIYAIESTPSLNQPFQLMQTVGSLTDGDISIELPMSPGHGFYRVAEQVY